MMGKKGRAQKYAQIIYFYKCYKVFILIGYDLNRSVRKSFKNFAFRQKSMKIFSEHFCSFESRHMTVSILSLPANRSQKARSCATSETVCLHF